MLRRHWGPPHSRHVAHPNSHARLSHTGHSVRPNAGRVTVHRHSSYVLHLQRGSPCAGQRVSVPHLTSPSRVARCGHVQFMTAPGGNRIPSGPVNDCRESDL